MTLPYKAIEHPQAFAHASALTQMTAAMGWDLYAAGEISLLYKSGDAAGQGVTMNGSTITFAEPGVYVLRVSCTYIADLTGTLVNQGKITLDDSTLSEPTEQAIAEGAQFTEHTSARQPLAFERTVNVDATLTVGLWVLHISTAETEGDLTITSLTIEVERAGEPSYPLPGFWNVNATDTLIQANVLEDTEPAEDGFGVGSIVRREGAGNWTQATEAQQGTYEVDGFNSILPGLSLDRTDPNWYQLDSQASQFNGDPSFCYFEVFDAPVVNLIGAILDLESAAGTEYCSILWVSDTSLGIVREGTSGPEERTASGLVVGRNWIAISRDGAAGTVTMWVNSLTPGFSGALGGGTFNPAFLTLCRLRSLAGSEGTRTIRRSHLAVNKTFRQSHVDRMVELVTRWGEI